MDNDVKVFLVGLLILLICILLGIGYSIAPGVREAVNENQFAVQKADDATNYKTIKKVEDTCRAMIASYEADKLTWQQYKDSKSEEQQGWAANAMLRANRTAATYNTYILENSFVWADNVPEDIDMKLPYLENKE